MLRRGGVRREGRITAKEEEIECLAPETLGCRVDRLDFYINCNIFTFQTSLCRVLGKKLQYRLN